MTGLLRKLRRGARKTRVTMLLLLGAIPLVACGGSGSEEGAMRRGDQAFARGDLPEALAEYRLGLRQGDRTVELLVRAAHAYARSGRIEEARAHYAEAVALDSAVANLAASDLLRVAGEAVARDDGIAAATAYEAAMEIRPGVSLSGVALPLARHFARRGQYGQAVPFFEKAVLEAASSPDVVYEMARAHRELGDCERALIFFEQARNGLRRDLLSELDYYVGDCSTELARAAQMNGDTEEALRMYQNTISIGEPRRNVAPAWFEIAEILAARGECAAAVRAFENVIEVLRQDQATGALWDRARDRIDQIRFGRGTDGPC
ncbi:MAG: tetratricopeptide repeat protein [Gemmatimonadota bacterium]